MAYRPSHSSDPQFKVSEPCLTAAAVFRKLDELFLVHGLVCPPFQEGTTLDILFGGFEQLAPAVQLHALVYFQGKKINGKDPKEYIQKILGCKFAEGEMPTTRSSWNCWDLSYHNTTSERASASNKVVHVIGILIEDGGLKLVYAEGSSPIPLTFAVPDAKGHTILESFESVHHPTVRDIYPYQILKPEA